MGGLTHTNTDWSTIGKASWWHESYWARGAADLVTFARDTDPGEGETIVEDSYDFEASSVNDPAPRGTYKRALNNAAVSDQGIYMPGLPPYQDPDGYNIMPNRRLRKGVKSPTEPLPWGEGTYSAAKMNAIQRQGGYGDSTQYAGAFPTWTAVAGSRKGNLQVLYGKICADPPIVSGADNGQWFYVDDGSGKNVKCYCPGGVYTTDIAEGNYVRMLGSLQGNNPNEWYWNNFHYITWNEDPALRAMSKPWPYEFQTYTWNITVLN